MKELDNIIFDVKPHEVDEAVKLLEKWGYTFCFDFAEANGLEQNSVRVYDGGIFISWRSAKHQSDVWFICTLEELRTVTAELKADDIFKPKTLAKQETQNNPIQ